MGTPDFALPALDYLVSSEYELVAVYTQPDKASGRGRSSLTSPVKKAALDNGLEVFQPVSLKQAKEREKLARLSPGVIVTAAYGQLLPGNILDIPSYGCLNIHPSLLPRHRGPSPVAATILAGDETAGVSIMLMDEGMDTGPVITRQKCPLSLEDTTGSLTRKLANIGAKLLKQTLPLWLGGEITPEPQEEEKATYSRLIRKGEGRIDWQRPADELGRRVRAFQPWPACNTTWRGKILKVVSAFPLPGSGEPGHVVAVQEKQGISLGVQTGEGILGLRQLQLEGKRVMTAEEFVRGQKDFIGAFLPC